ncbi:MAG: hypothetical protein IPK60_05245 [Sandaracinaceae bacterium]|nr:hypothetical protein [Sandaracinaceae bacterium]
MRNGIVPAAICTGHADAPGARHLRRISARDRNLLLLGTPNLHDAHVVRLLRAAKPDAILSWFWPFKIPHEVLALAPRGAFGVHPSLLPRWRGRDPYFWAIREGDVETGVTLHRLDAEYDTGAIIEQQSLSIRDTDTAWTLAKRLDRPSLRLLVSCAQRLQKGEALAGAPQPLNGICEAPRPSDEDIVISFHDNTDSILRLIRAAAPEPGASAQIDDEFVSVLEAKRSEATIPRALQPSEAFVDNDGNVHVVTNDGALTLVRVRTEDDRVLTRRDIQKLLAK